MGYIIEDLGFTTDDYITLKKQGKSDPYIYEEVLFVSYDALKAWKKRHGLIGYSVRGQYRKYQRRDKHEVSIMPG